MQEFSFHLDADTDNAASFLAEGTGLSKTHIKEVMNKGAVWMERNGSIKRLRRARTRLLKGDRLAVYYDEEIIRTEPPEPQLIEDHKMYSIWFKPPGLLSSGSRLGDHCAINRWVETHLQPERPVFLVHRLDSNASGLMILAHGKKIAAHLSKQFQDRSVIKEYTVEVMGNYEGPAVIDTPLDGKEAISHVKVISVKDDITCLNVRIETGRKHQIRRHLADKGYPVIGDRLYGGRASDHIHLNASLLSFRCPVTGEVRITKCGGRST